MKLPCKVEEGFCSPIQYVLGSFQPQFNLEMVSQQSYIADLFS